MAQTPPVERGESVLLPRTNALSIPSDILFLCFSGVCFSLSSLLLLLQPRRSVRAVPRSRWPRFNRHSPRGLLVLGDRSRLCPVGSRRGCPVPTRGTESRDRCPVAPSPSSRLPPKHSEKQKIKVPVYETFREIPFISQPKEGQRAPAGLGTGGRSGPAGIPRRKRDKEKKKIQKNKPSAIQVVLPLPCIDPRPRGPFPAPLRGPPVPGSPSGTRDRGGKFTNEA